MRVLGVLAAWGVLAVLATMCFALGGSIGYRQGVRDTLAQIRERRAGKAGCRPLPANHLRRRSSGHLRPGARARRARWRTGPTATPITTGRAATPTGSTWSVLTSSRLTAGVAACLAGLLLFGVPVTAVSASTAGPQDRMYGVKLAMEQVKLAAAVGPERDAQVHVDLARARLAELAVLEATEADPAAVHRVVDEVESHYEAVAERSAKIAEPEVLDTLQRDMAAVVAEQSATVERVVAASGCEERTDGACSELAQVHEETVDLQVASAQRAGTGVAVADVGAAESASVAAATADADVVEAESAAADANAADSAERAGKTAREDATTAGARVTAPSAPSSPETVAEPKAKATPAATERASAASDDAPATKNDKKPRRQAKAGKSERPAETPPAAEGTAASAAAASATPSASPTPKPKPSETASNVGGTGTTGD